MKVKQRQYFNLYMHLPDSNDNNRCDDDKKNHNNDSNQSMEQCQSTACAQLFHKKSYMNWSREKSTDKTRERLIDNWLVLQ